MRKLERGVHPVGVTREIRARDALRGDVRRELRDDGDAIRSGRVRIQQALVVGANHRDWLSLHDPRVGAERELRPCGLCSQVEPTNGGDTVQRHVHGGAVIGKRQLSRLAADGDGSTDRTGNGIDRGDAVRTGAASAWDAGIQPLCDAVVDHVFGDESDLPQITA